MDTTYTTIRSHCVGTTAVVYASDYHNKLTGEKIERECRRQLDSNLELRIDLPATAVAGRGDHHGAGTERLAATDHLHQRVEHAHVGPVRQQGHRRGQLDRYALVGAKK